MRWRVTPTIPPIHIYKILAPHSIPNLYFPPDITVPIELGSSECISALMQVCNCWFWHLIQGRCNCLHSNQHVSMKKTCLQWNKLCLPVIRPRLRSRCRILKRFATIWKLTKTFSTKLKGHKKMEQQWTHIFLNLYRPAKYCLLQVVSQKKKEVYKKVHFGLSSQNLTSLGLFLRLLILVCDTVSRFTSQAKPNIILHM